MTSAETGHDDHHQHLQGLSTILGDDAARADFLEKAFDFRGDVTLALRDQRQITGYIFDRRRGATPGQSVVRLLTSESDVPVSVRFDEIVRIDFGKDTAAGKSFETWVKKYIEKKLKGEQASIESEAL